MSNNTGVNYTCVPFLNEGPAIWTQYPAAVTIIVVLSLMQKRKNMRNHCNGYPGWIYPVNLLDVCENRFGYAMAFGASTTAVLALFTNQTFDKNYWISVLLGIFIVFRISVVYYPLFACLSSKFRLLGSFLGLLHTAQLATIHLIGVIYCPSFKSLGPYSNVVMNLPIFICLAWLLCHFGYLTIHAIYNYFKGIRETEKLKPFIYLQNYQYIHVKLLLKAAEESDFETDEEKKPNAVRDFFKKYLYKSKPHFKYPPRIICTFVVTAIALYEVTVIFYYLASNIFDPFESWVLRYSEYLTIILNASRRDNLQFVYNCRDTWIVGTVIASSLNALYLSHMFVLYRINKLKLYRGDKAQLPIQQYTSFGSVIQSSVCYAGYQISYMIWAFVALHAILFLGIIFVIYCIIYPIEGVGSTWFLDFVIPIGTCTILINIGQFLASKYFFCQEHGNVNALDNRRIYHNFAYFIFFYNVMCGFFSCLFRIGKSIILGLLLLSRMDCSLLMSPFEMFDSGFDSYLGFLFVEHIHCHPVLATFCEILLNDHFQQSSHDMKVLYYGNSDDVTTYVKTRESDYKIRNKKAYNRWRLAVVLIRNKRLRKLRKSYLEELKEIERLEEEQSDLASKKRRKLSVNSLLDNVRNSKYDIASSSQFETKMSGTIVHNVMAGSRESIRDTVEGNRSDSKVISNDQTAEQQPSPSANADSSNNDKLITVRGSVVIETDRGRQVPSFNNSTDNLSVQGIKSTVEFSTDHDASRKRSLLRQSSSEQALDSVGRIFGSHESKGASEHLV